MPLELGPARPEELDALANALAPLPLFAAYRLGPKELSERFFGALERGEGLWVARDAEGPVGVCWFLRKGTFATGAYLRTLAVAPGRERSGIGAELLRAFEAECAEAPGGLFLLVSDFNHDAQRFYRRHGYVEVGTLAGFATAGVTERVFWKAKSAQAVD